MLQELLEKFLRWLFPNVYMLVDTLDALEERVARLSADVFYRRRVVEPEWVN